MSNYDHRSSKVCTKCGEEKATSEFYLNIHGRPKPECKDCKKSYEKVRAALRPKLVRYKLKVESDATREIIEHYFTYDRDAGIFYRRFSTGGRNGAVGSAVGTVNDGGYTVICLGGRDFRAHRLVWFMEHGEFPPKHLVIDHINRNPADNRISNLRAVPQKLNAHNFARPKKNNKLGVLGVHRNKKRFSARIYNPDGLAVHLGTFDTIEIAKQVYINAKQTFYPQAVIA